MGFLFKHQLIWKKSRNFILNNLDRLKSIELYNRVQAVFSEEERNFFMCFTQEKQTSESFLAEKKTKENQGYPTAIFSAILHRGDNPDVQEIIIPYLPRTWAELKQISGRTARKDAWGTICLLLNEDEIRQEIRQIADLLKKGTIDSLETEDLLLTLLNLRQEYLNWLPTSQDYEYYRLFSVYSSWQLRLFGMYLSAIRGSQDAQKQSHEEDAAALLRMLQVRLEDIQSCWETFQGKDHAVNNIRDVILRNAQINEKLFETYLKDTLVPFALPSDEMVLSDKTDLLSKEYLNVINVDVETEMKRRALTIDLPFLRDRLDEEGDKTSFEDSVKSIVATPVLFALWPKLSVLMTPWLEDKSKHGNVVNFLHFLSNFNQQSSGDIDALASFLPTLLAQSGKLPLELFVSLIPMFVADNLAKSNAWCALDKTYFEKLTQVLAGPYFNEQHQANPSRKKKELVPLFALLARRLRLKTAVDFERYDFSLEAMQRDYLATLLTETTAIPYEQACLCLKSGLSQQDIETVELTHTETSFYQMVSQHLSFNEHSESYSLWVQAVITEPQIVNNTGYLSFLSQVLDSSYQTAAVFQQLPDELEIILLSNAYCNNNRFVINALQENKEMLAGDRDKFKAILRIINEGYWKEQTSVLVKTLLQLSLNDINKLSDLLTFHELGDDEQARQQVILVLNKPDCLDKRLKRIPDCGKECLSKSLFLLKQGVPFALQINKLSFVWDRYEIIESYLSIDELTHFDSFILKHDERSLDECSSAFSALVNLLDCINANTDQSTQLKALLLNQMIKQLDTMEANQYQSYLEAITFSYQALLNREMKVENALAILTSSSKIHSKLYRLYQQCETFSETGSSDLLYLLLMRLEQNSLSDDEFDELIDNHGSTLSSIQHRLANNTTKFSLQEQAKNQPKQIIEQGVKALESDTWKPAFQLDDHWRVCRPIRIVMMRIMVQGSLLPVENIPKKETLPFWDTLWTSCGIGAFVEQSFAQYDRYLRQVILTPKEDFSRLVMVSKDTLKNYGFFNQEQVKNIYRHAQELEQVTEGTSYSVQKSSQTEQLFALKDKLLECIHAYSGFFNISPSRRQLRNEVEVYIRDYLSKESFDEQPYIHLMNYLAGKLQDAQLLDQAKVHQHSFHKKGYSRLTNLLKVMQDHVLIHAMQDTEIDPVAYRSQFKDFATSSNAVKKAVLKTLSDTLSCYQPQSNNKQTRLNGAVTNCQAILQTNSDGETTNLLEALQELHAAMGDRTEAPMNLGKLKHCVSQALYYCEMTESENQLNGICNDPVG